MDNLNGSKHLNAEQIERFLDDNEVKSRAFLYFNYGDNGDSSPEEIKQFEKLKKLGAKISEYFDGRNLEDAEDYENKMQAKGYRLFDISTGNDYLWLLIKDKKIKNALKKGDDNQLSVQTLIDEIRNGI